jgi:nitroreductase
MIRIDGSATIILWILSILSEFMTQPRFIPLPSYREFSPEEMRQRAAVFREHMLRRRTVRYFSDRPVLREIIADCLTVAGSAPSGANLQPWHFVVISDPAIKRQIRAAAEREEQAFYHGRAPQEWLEALAPLGTDEHKPYLESAPYLIAIFAQSYGLLPDGRKVKNYYVQESVGIATGMLITALHHAGLVSLTHTPSPMGFLNEILNRPAHEKPFLLLVTGYPAENAVVPDIGKKPLSEIVTFV